MDNSGGASGKRGGPYTDEELAGLLKEEISRSEGYDTDELAGSRTSALQYFYGKPRGDEMKGRSQVQSLDVADMIHAILAQMMPAFSSDCVVQFDPTSNKSPDEDPLQGFNPMLISQVAD